MDYIYIYMDFDLVKDSLVSILKTNNYHLNAVLDEFLINDPIK